jgi:hypothetical protein
MYKKLSLALIVSVVAQASQANAAVLSFGAQHGAFYISAATFADQGFTFHYTPLSNGFAEVANPASCSPACVGDGVDAFYSFNSGTLGFAATNGAAFSLDSLKLAQTFTDERALDVLVTGTLSGGGTVSQEITEASNQDKVFNTFSLPSDFSDLSSVTISGVGRYPTTEFAVNGITVGGASAVPEPSSTVLFMAGITASLALAQRRRSSKR